MKVSFSSLTAFQTCPTMYKYRYVDGRVPVRDATALYVGTMAHEATAIWWQHGPEEARDYLQSVCGDVDPVDVARIIGALSVYNPPKDKYEIVGIEVPFKVRVYNPATNYPMHDVVLRGFADMLLLEKATGRLMVREYKTTASEIIGFGPFWGKLMVDTQIAIYREAFGADGVLYDVTRKPQLRISAADRKGRETDTAILEAFQARVIAKCAEEPSEWHQFREIPKIPSEIDTDRESVYIGVKELVAGVKSGSYPRHPHSCVMYGQCRYLDVCSGRACLDDDELFQDYVRS